MEISVLTLSILVQMDLFALIPKHYWRCTPKSLSSAILAALTLLLALVSWIGLILQRHNFAKRSPPLAIVILIFFS